MKNATIRFLLPNAFPISKTGFYNEIYNEFLITSVRPSGCATRDDGDGVPRGRPLTPAWKRHVPPWPASAI